MTATAVTDVCPEIPPPDEVEAAGPAPAHHLGMHSKHAHAVFREVVCSCALCVARILADLIAARANQHASGVRDIDDRQYAHFKGRESG